MWGVWLHETDFLYSFGWGWANNQTTPEVFASPRVKGSLTTILTASVCWKDLFQMWGSSDVSKMCWGSLRGHKFVCLLEIAANKQSMELMTKIVSLKSIDFYTLILDHLYVVSVSTLFGFVVSALVSNVAVSRGLEKTHLSPLKGQ